MFTEDINHIIGSFKDINFTQLKQEMLQHLQYVPYFKRHVARFDRSHLPFAGPIMSQIIEELFINFDICPIGLFVNYYKDGNDYAPYHKDMYDAKTLTISFGGKRDFYIKSDDQSFPVKKYILGHGDIFYFSKQINSTCKHSIPKRTRCLEDRISILVFFN